MIARFMCWLSLSIRRSMGNGQLGRREFKIGLFDTTFNVYNLVHIERSVEEANFEFAPTQLPITHRPPDAQAQPTHKARYHRGPKTRNFAYLKYIVRAHWHV